MIKRDQMANWLLWWRNVNKYFLEDNQIWVNKMKMRQHQSTCLPPVLWLPYYSSSITKYDAWFLEEIRPLLYLFQWPDFVSSVFFYIGSVYLRNVTLIVMSNEYSNQPLNLSPLVLALHITALCWLVNSPGRGHHILMNCQEGNWWFNTGNF